MRVGPEPLDHAVVRHRLAPALAHGHAHAVGRMPVDRARPPCRRPSSRRGRSPRIRDGSRAPPACAPAPCGPRACAPRPAARSCPCRAGARCRRAAAARASGRARAARSAACCRGCRRPGGRRGRRACSRRTRAGPRGPARAGCPARRGPDVLRQRARRSTTFSPPETLSRGRRGDAVHQHLAVVDPGLEPAARVVGQQRGQRLVQALPGLRRRYFDRDFEGRAGHRGAFWPMPGALCTGPRPRPHFLYTSAPPRRPQRPTMATAHARRPLLVVFGLHGRCGAGRCPAARAAETWPRWRRPTSSTTWPAQDLRGNNYKGAIQKLESLESHYPFTNAAKQGQLDLMFAYYKNKEAESAIDQADQFIRENPTHPRVDYAYYIKGLVYFESGAGWLEDVLHADVTKRPPHESRKALQAFQVLLQQYPKSPYAADARQRMIFLRNRLADYELAVARYYMQREAYVAAVNRARAVIENYDGSPAAIEALGIMSAGYQQARYPGARDGRRRGTPGQRLGDDPTKARSRIAPGGGSGTDQLASAPPEMTHVRRARPRPAGAAARNPLQLHLVLRPRDRDPAARRRGLAPARRAPRRSGARAARHACCTRCSATSGSCTAIPTSSRTCSTTPGAADS